MANRVADLLAERLYNRLQDDLRNNRLSLPVSEEDSAICGDGECDEFEFTCDLK